MIGTETGDILGKIEPWMIYIAGTVLFVIFCCFIILVLISLLCRSQTLNSFKAAQSLQDSFQRQHQLQQHTNYNVNGSMIDDHNQLMSRSNEPCDTLHVTHKQNSASVPNSIIR